MNALAACCRAVDRGLCWWIARCQRLDALERRREREHRRGKR